MKGAGSVVVFALLWTVYMATAAPGTTFFDTGELSVGAFLLGNGHPPGQPLYFLIAKAFSLLPFASVPFRLTLLSAATTAAAISLLPGVVMRLAERARLAAPSPLIVYSLIPGLGLLLPVWLQAVRVEVYALHLLLAILLLHLSLAPSAGGWPNLGAIALLTGLGLANHSLLLGLMGPGIVLLLLPLRPKALVLGVPLGLMGVSTYLYGPLRSSAGALLDWTSPTSLDAFVGMVTARAYQSSFVRLTLERLGLNLELHAALFVALLGVPLLVFAMAGLVRCSQAPRMLVALLLLVGGNIAATAAQSVFFPDNPDALGYLAFSCVLIGLLALLGVDALARALEQRFHRLAVRREIRQVAFVVLGLSVVTGPALRAVSVADLHEHHADGDFGRALLTELPPGAAYLAATDATSFATWVGMVLEQRRPDVLTAGIYDGTRRLLNLSSEAPPNLPSSISPLERVKALTQHFQKTRPVYLSAHDLPVRMDLSLRAAPTSFRVVPLTSNVPLTAGLLEVERYWQKAVLFWRRAPAYLLERQARLRVPAHLEALGDHYRALHLLKPALQAYALAESLDPDPQRLVRRKRARVEDLLSALPSKRDLEGASASELPLLLILARADLEAAQESLASATTELERDQAKLLVSYLEGDFHATTEAFLALAASQRDAPSTPRLLIRLEPALNDDQALPWLKERLRIVHEPELLAAVAWRLTFRGELETAEAVIGEARRTRDVLPLLVAEGWLEYQRNRLAASGARANEALALDPTDPGALRLASSLWRAGVPTHLGAHD